MHLLCFFVALWTVAPQDPLSVGFPRQDYWSGLPFPPPEDLPHPGIEPMSPALTGVFFITVPPGKILAKCSHLLCPGSFLPCGIRRVFRLLWKFKLLVMIVFLCCAGLEALLVFLLLKGIISFLFFFKLLEYYSAGIGNKPSFPSAFFFHWKRKATGLEGRGEWGKSLLLSVFALCISFLSKLPQEFLQSGLISSWKASFGRNSSSEPKL